MICSAKVVLSTILPRDVNLGKTGTHYTAKEFLSINSSIGVINEALQKISSRVPGLYVVDHPQFLHDNDFINDSLLAADGLHLNFEGTRVAVSNFESAILEVRRDLVKAEFEKLQQQEISVPDHSMEIDIQCEQRLSTAKDILPFSDVVRFGDTKPQPVIVPKVPLKRNVRQTPEPTPSRQQPTQKRQKSSSRFVKRIAVPSVSVPKSRHKSKMPMPKTQRTTIRSFSNRFSVLDVEDTLSDCDNNDDTPELKLSHQQPTQKKQKTSSKYVKRNSVTSVGGPKSRPQSKSMPMRKIQRTTLRSDCVDNDETQDMSFNYVRMTGGGKVKGDDIIISSESPTSNSEECAKESVTVEVITSIDDESSCDSKTRKTLENSTLVGEERESTKKGEVQCDNVPSVEKELHELETSFRDTNDDESVEDECLDKSVLEVIHLLNDNEKTSKSHTEQICENVDSGIKIAKKIVEGQTFSSYDEFSISYDDWCTTNNHPMKTDSSKKNDEESNLFPYRQIRFSCKHAGKARIRGEGKRPVQAYFACECPVVLRLMYDSKGKNYTVSKLVDEHNQTTSKSEYKHYTTNRKLNDDEFGDVKALIDLQVETKNIKTYMREKKTGKVVQSKDISNIKQTVVREKEAGLTKGQLLAAALNELSEKKHATTHIQLDKESG